MKCNLWLSSGLFIVFSITTLAQSSKSVPTLTTDDVLGSRVSSPVAPPPPTPPKSPDNKSQPPASNSEATGKAVPGIENPEEKAWNEQRSQMQEKVRSLNHQADQTEMEITSLRNRLHSAAARAPETNNQINAQMNALASKMKQLRAEAQTAQEQLEVLIAEGQSKNYKTKELALENAKGEPDTSAYRIKEEQLQNELRAAVLRVDVLQLRLNNVQAESLRKGNGDNYTLNKIRAEREQLADELEKTRSKINELNNKLDELRRKAGAAHVRLQ